MPSPARLLLCALALSACAAQAQDGAVRQGAKNAPHLTPAFPNQTRAPESISGVSFTVETVARGLSNPWGIDLLPSGDYLVTERAGRLRIIRRDGTVSAPIAGLPETFSRRQGGLLDVKVGPNFAFDRLIYWTYSKPMGGSLSATAAARGRLSEDETQVTDVQDLFVQQPPSPTPMHYGSRIVFDGAGHAFVTTGEHSSRSERRLAQNLATGYGKTIRIALNGAIPADNPYAAMGGAASSVWSYGHRNMQGALIHPETGAFWTIEHGPRGGDELNLVRPGLNYGWPVVSYGINYNGDPVGSGESSRPEMTEPVYYWDPVIAPGDMTIYQGAMFPEFTGDFLIASLNPGGVVRLEMAGDRVTGEERLFTGQGRVRDVAVDIDGALLVLMDAANGALLRLTRGR